MYMRRESIVESFLLRGFVCVCVHIRTITLESGVFFFCLTVFSLATIFQWDLIGAYLIESNGGFIGLQFKPIANKILSQRHMAEHVYLMRHLQDSFEQIPHVCPTHTHTRTYFKF